ncbi:hypothetical protein HYW21_03770 [Candidatus Woesearchaeota archaeon]|nr:hypothetical protein [Candidatus Woesearchaeota archaeon]
METISVRFEENFIDDLEKVMKEHRYATKTEFIREAIRDKIKDLEKQEALLQLERMYGAGVNKRKMTPKVLRRAREEAAREIAQKLGTRLE